MGSNDKYKDKPFFYWEEFIVWLNGFSLKHSSFDNHFFERCKELSKNDVCNICDLEMLFYKVRDYAKDNYLDCVKVDNREAYFIYFEDFSYEISKDDNNFYCAAVPKYMGYDFIDFNNVITDKRLEYSYVIDEKLNMLASMVDVLYRFGIPLSAIKDKVDNTVRVLSDEKVVCKKRIR